MAIKNIFIILFLTFLLFGCTQESTNTLQQKYDALQSEHTKLRQMYDTLSNQLNEKDTRLAILLQNQTKYTGDYASLQEKYDEVVLSRDQFSSLYQNLTAKYTDLSDRYRDLEYKSTSSAGRLPKDIPGAPRLSGIDVLLTPDGLFIKQDKLNLSSVTDTKSMNPTITADHTAIFTTDFIASNLPVGTIIAYRSPSFQIPIMHRIIKLDSDSQGLCYSIQGDNNPSPDPECVKPSQIIGVVIGTVFSTAPEGYHYCSSDSIPVVKDGTFICASKIIPAGVYATDQSITDTPLLVFPFCSDEEPNKPYTVIGPDKQVYCYETVH